jgi:hypothetical protein
VIATGFLVVVALAAVAYVVGVEAIHTRPAKTTVISRRSHEVEGDTFAARCLHAVLVEGDQRPRIQVRPEVNTVTVTVTVEGKP